MLYSGLVLGTVILSSVFNDQSLVYALVLNAPYMLCGALVFLYFFHAFTLYKGSKRRPARRRNSVVLAAIADEAVAISRQVEKKRATRRCARPSTTLS